MFKLTSTNKPTGDQPDAIQKLYYGLQKNVDFQTLLGVTGSGKTFTIANLIQKHQKPTLILCHNKTLAAQNYSEFKEFFPENAVHYFVSYYDYYQPEAYVPARDLFIEKEADINQEIERMRSSATTALLTRDDVIIVASVSCIYGLGDPVDFSDLKVTVKKGDRIDRSKLTRRLVDIQYTRNDNNFYYGNFRIRGDSIDIFPPYLEYAIRLEMFDDEVEKILNIDHLTGEVLQEVQSMEFFPAKEFVTPFDKLKVAEPQIIKELEQRVDYFQRNNRLLEAERIKQRTNYDLEMLRETGYTSGIENYSRYIDRREPGTPPSTLIDYFPKDFLLVVDESHITLPQVRGMYNGDHSRKETLVEFGFRLPSAMDNRPLKFDEFLGKLDNVVCITATPGDWELERTKESVAKSEIPTDPNSKYPKNGIIELINRPTGLLDPQIEIRPSKNQIDDIMDEIKMVLAKKQRVIITTLTKRMAEDLSEYLANAGIKVHYLHSDIDTIERVDILRDLRLGVYDVLVGINLLREGIDLPEVSLIIILDADKEGFLRSATSLIQIVGRAARHEEGRVIMYADRETDSMKKAIEETNRRRKIQEEYNKEHHIVPKTIVKAIREGLVKKEEITEHDATKLDKRELETLVRELTEKMQFAARNLEFEKAAELRDQIRILKQMK